MYKKEKGLMSYTFSYENLKRSVLPALNDSKAEFK
jgi:hypothetical protein